MDGDERRWLTIILVIAMITRVVAVAGLFVLTDHTRVPFGSFFGDEEYFIRRSMWLRNVALGVPIHGADLIYAFEDYSKSSYLYVLAFVQILVGPAPYGVHLLGISFYVCGAVVLFRLIRPSFGRMPAAGGLLALLFLPSMFAWSISGLKEPLFFLMTSAGLVLAVQIVRGPSLWRRAAALLALVVVAWVLETIRLAGAVITVASVVFGFAIAALATRPRLLLATVVALPI